MTTANNEDAPLLTPRELAKLVGVDARTLTNWVAIGYLTEPSRTAGGHKRFDPARVAADFQGHGDAVPARLKAFIDANSAEATAKRVIARASTDELRAELARREERGAAFGTDRPRAETRGAA